MNLKNAEVGVANPMLLIVSGLCPVLIPSFTLQNGLILGLGVFLHALLLAFSIPLILRFVGKRLHFLAALGISALAAAMYRLALGAVFPYQEQVLAPYLAFLALNCFSLSVLRGSIRQDSLEKLPEYARSAGSFLVSLMVFSALREAVGSGQITFLRMETLQVVLDLRFLVRAPLRIALLPAGAFLLLGYAVALYRMRITTKKGGAA